MFWLSYGIGDLRGRMSVRYSVCRGKKEKGKLLTHGITFARLQFDWQTERGISCNWIRVVGLVCFVEVFKEFVEKATSAKYVPHWQLLFYVILLIYYVIRITRCQLCYCLLTVLKMNINHFNIISTVLLITVNLHNQLYMSSVCSTVSDMFRHITVAIFKECSRLPS